MNKTGTRKVLVVDDEPDLVESLTFLLEGADWQVETASDGYAALGAALVFRPDVILLDVMMPRENGYRVARRVREAQAAGLLPRTTRIVLLTARKLDHDPERERLFEHFARPDLVIYKPFDVDHLLAAVADLLARPADPAAPLADAAAPPAAG
jgi:DNA-binding response OmpR family regulator